MADVIAFENGIISNFQGLVTLTLDWVILYTVVHHASTFTYMPFTACTVVQAVVKATSQSNGKGQILTPWGS